LTKKTILFLCGLFSTLFLFAQKPIVEEITITGKIIEGSTKQPLEYATVVLKNEETSEISGGITDQNGLFKIKTKKGTYAISFEFISFKTKKLPKQILSVDKNFKTISLSEDTKALDEIVIIA
jgi:hypothetical protein